jgi:hypothetical protein
MTIVVLNTDPAILASIGPTGPLAPAPDGAALVVVTDRPSPAQAAAALLLGARAYLPLGLHARGWEWTQATQASGTDPASVQRWFADLLP